MKKKAEQATIYPPPPRTSLFYIFWGRGWGGGGGGEGVGGRLWGGGFPLGLVERAVFVSAKFRSFFQNLKSDMDPGEGPAWLFAGNPE